MTKIIRGEIDDKYCIKCGALLSITLNFDRYDRKTGKKLFWIKAKCPKIQTFIGMIIDDLSPYYPLHSDVFVSLVDEDEVKKGIEFK